MKLKPKKRKHGLSQMQRLLETSIRQSVQIARLQRRLKEIEQLFKA